MVIQSAKARKQRRAFFQAPKHRIYRDFVVPHDTVGDKKFNRIKRAVVRKGDTVVIRRGQKTGEKDTNVKRVEGKVLRIDYNRRLLFIEDLKIRKRGNKVADRPVEPRNVTIVAFDLTDPRRKAKLEGAQNPEKSA
jgi:ribosomal protein uL24